MNLDVVPVWAEAIIGLVMVVAALAPIVARHLPVRTDKATDPFSDYGYICSHTSARHCRIDEGAREPWPHRSPDGTALCCDQGVVAWPYPCPWHPAEVKA